MKLYQQQFGNGADLVLIHGWGFDHRIWQPLLSRHTLPYRITLIDLPGFGESSPLSAYSLTSLSDAILAHLPKTAIYLGWSLGGLVATHIAQHFPQRVSALINVASSPKFIADSNWPGISKEALQQFSDALQQHYHATLARFITLQCHHPASNKSLLRELKNTFMNTNTNTLATLQQTLPILMNSDLRSDLSTITCPMLYLLGRLDSLIPVKIQDTITTLAPHAKTVVFSEAAHIPFVSHPEMFVQAIRHFLEPCYA